MAHALIALQRLNNEQKHLTLVHMCLSANGIIQGSVFSFLLSTVYDISKKKCDLPNIEFLI
jgi:hypothetical protein